MQNEKEMFVSIVQKVHKAGGDEALERFLLSNGEDCPPIKLTPQEMEFLKGGGFFGWIKRNIIDPVVGFIKDNKDLIDAVKTVASVAAVI